MGDTAASPAEGWALVDTHAHLDDKAFDADRAEIMPRARAAGVSYVLTAGTDLPSSRQAVALAADHEGVYAAVGVHPHEAAHLDEATLSELRLLAGQPKVVAIGEVGLDFYRDLSPRPQQQAALRAHLALAQELDLPVIVHDRDAHAEVLAALRAWRQGYPQARGVLHAFSGDEAMAREAIELGFYISFAGPLTFPKADKLRHLAAALPLERLLVETDCPYLTPVPLRGRRNEPANVRLVAEKLAEVRGITLAEAAQATTANARQLFRLQ
ncbi:MAG: TatD family hydrolase [Dehalococcoidales bacterium]|nr:TatD family hydrolase [Dehalococcoidales bacterium]